MSLYFDVWNDWWTKDFHSIKHCATYKKMIELLICIHILVYSRLPLLPFPISWIGCRANSVISVLHTANASLLIVTRLIHVLRSDVLLSFLYIKLQTWQKNSTILTGENTNDRLLVCPRLHWVPFIALVMCQEFSRS